MSGLFYNMSVVESKTHSIEQTKKKYTKKKNTKQLSVFEKAYRDARKKGLKTFKLNGKTYTTEKKETKKDNIKTKTKKNTSASYKNVSFGSAYRDARKKGYETFKWKGKLYSTDLNKKTNKKTTYKKKKTTPTYGGTFSSAYRDAKKKGYSTFKWKGKLYTTGKLKKYTKKKKYKKKKYTRKKKYTKKKTYYPPTNTYTPPPTYESEDNSKIKRRESFKKEPKKEGQ